jgi:OOP family OmpA-OmpF porin
MTKNHLKLFLLLAMGILMMSCAAQKIQMPVAKAPEVPFVPQKFDLERYEQKVDNFIVLFDASFSMRSQYGKESKFTLAKEFVSRMNQTLPDLDVNAGLRSFGHHPSVSNKNTARIYGNTKYTKEELGNALKALKYPGGVTPMAEGIDAAAEDLKSTTGQTAAIIISDGEKDLLKKDPVAAAEAIKRSYGDRLCIYAVTVGEVPEIRDPFKNFFRWLAGKEEMPAGKALMDKIVQAGKCGFSLNATDHMSSQAMAEFVEKVFLVKYTDSDGDGVWDHLDQCPNTPKGVKVDEKGCPIPKPKPQPKAQSGPRDTDGDGVYDDKDRCKDTPKGARVDDRGCWVISNLRFDFDKAEIKPEYYSILDEVVSVMKMNPLMDILIEGHTDSVGSDKYNQSLSERRSQSVKKYLVSKGVESKRMTAMGFGESRPIASNESEKGRSKNRRVELTPKYKY